MKYLKGNEQKAIHGVTFDSNMKTGQIIMRLTDIPCHYVTIGCLSHNLRSTLKKHPVYHYILFHQPESLMMVMRIKDMVNREGNF